MQPLPLNCPQATAADGAPLLSHPKCSAGVYVEVERARLEADPAWRGMQVCCAALRCTALALSTAAPPDPRLLPGRLPALCWAAGRACCAIHRARHPELLCILPLSCLQRLDLRLTGVAAAGALQLEVMRGGYISGSKVG